VRYRWLGRIGASGLAVAAVLLTGEAQGAPSASVFAVAPDDAKAVTIDAPRDGRADAAPAIQAALDAAAAKPGGAIVFLPSGRYRFSRTVFVWPGVRLFGVGATKPVFVLAPNTAGFQKGLATMLIFAGTPPANTHHVPFSPQDAVPPRPNVGDANPGTFYSAMSNVAFEIGAGNPAAIGVRFHAAQHAYLSHIDFDIGSGLAGIYQVGNAMEDIRFHGGRYGILTEKPSPAWQFTLIDASFDGQREAAIREHEAGLTLVNVSIRDVPVGIDIDKGYGDWLWGKDVRFERVSKAGVVISNEDNAYTQIGFENALASDTPVFARFRDSGKAVAGKGRSYKVSAFNYGLMLPGLGQMGRYGMTMEAAAIPSMPVPAKPAIRPLPPVSEWVSVKTLGAKGDGQTDDTAALQHAIDTHRVLYLPQGFYRVTDTLRLRPDTVLIGLHPGLTQIVLPDGTPAYQGIGPAKALVEAPQGGDTIVSGLGLFTGGINPRATALLWKAGANSLVDDVKAQGGHGTTLIDGERFNPYNANQTGDPDPHKRWDAQYPSFWVTDGGGGTFANLWTPNTYASAGFLVSNTKTPGHIYELSSEHHVRNEIVLDGVENWELLAPQTEEEAGEGGDTVSLSIRNSRNILVANYHAYRVTRSLKPALAAAQLENAADIRFRNVHVNAESGLGTCDENGCATFLRVSKFPYANAIIDVTHGLQVREREFATLDVPAAPPAVALAGLAPRKLAGDFWSLGGGAVGVDGKLFFVDHHFQRIYGWSAREGLTTVRDDALDPVQLAVAKSGDLAGAFLLGRNGTVYSFDPKASGRDITVIQPTAIAPHSGARTLLPANWWVNGEFKDQIDPATYRFTTLAELFAKEAGEANAQEYVSPDGSVVLPAFRAFQQGQPNHLGWRFSHTLDASGLVGATPGKRLFVTTESEDRTYSTLTSSGGALTDLKPFANRGGESVVEGPDGRVYVANGQIFIYAADGRETGRIDVPERPLQLLFGGEDGRTLFILTHHSLYAVTP